MSEDAQADDEEAATEDEEESVAETETEDVEDVETEAEEETDTEEADAEGTEQEIAADGDGPVPVGVKLGSTRTVIAIPEGDDVRIIRTLTCLATYEDPITGEEQVLYGEEAATQYPDRVQFMLRSGLPEDDDRAELTKKFFDTVLAENDVPEDSVVVYAIP
ncbi:MAG: hypothetical protein ABEI77_04855, partial [Halorientalis sp.]